MLIGKISNIFQPIHLHPILRSSIKSYYIFIFVVLFIIYFIPVLIIVILVNKKERLKIVWPIKFLQIFLPLFSITFYGQIFLTLLKIFDNYKGNLAVSFNIRERYADMYKYIAPITAIGLGLISLTALITNLLYFKPIFNESSSDILKKHNSYCDITLLFSKILINLMFTLDKGLPSEHWLELSILTIFCGSNAFFAIFYQNRVNKVLIFLNEFFSLILFYAYFSIFISNIIVKFLDFTGWLYLFSSGAIIIFIFLLKQRKKDNYFLSKSHLSINTPGEYYLYVSKLNSLFFTQNYARKNYIIFRGFISFIELRCIDKNCPLKKYLENLNKGIESEYLLII